MADFNQFPPRQKTLLDDRKFTLYAANPSGGRASLKWAMAGPNPRITVWSGMAADKDNGKSEAKMDLKTFMAFLVILEKTIKTPHKEGEATGSVIEMGFYRDNRVNHISDLHIGRDKDGVIFISVVAKNGNTPVKFPFVTEEYHNFRHRGGEAYSKAETSEIMAAAYLKILEGIVPVLSDRNWKEPPPQQNGNQGNRNGNRGGGNYGGGNRNSGGGGSGRSYQSDTAEILDDDIDF